MAGGTFLNSFAWLLLITEQLAEFKAGLTHTKTKHIKCGFQLQNYNINLTWNFESLVVFHGYNSE